MDKDGQLTSPIFRYKSRKVQNGKYDFIINLFYARYKAI